MLLTPFIREPNLAAVGIGEVAPAVLVWRGGEKALLYRGTYMLLLK